MSHRPDASRRNRLEHGVADPGLAHHTDTARPRTAGAVVLQGYLKPRIHPIVSAIDRLRADEPGAEPAWREREAARQARCAEVVDRRRRDGRLRQGWDSVPNLVNLQDVAGTAKPYQVRQVLRLLERYDLHPEADS